MFSGIVEAYGKVIGTLSNWMYSYILIILLVGAGIYFTVKTKGVQFRALKEAIKVVMEPKDDEKSISSFQALMVSTASRVGTGNIAGISTALCIGGAGAMFWMWLIALLEAHLRSLRVHWRRSIKEKLLTEALTEALHTIFRLC